MQYVLSANHRSCALQVTVKTEGEGGEVVVLACLGPGGLGQ